MVERRTARLEGTRKTTVTKVPPVLPSATGLTVKSSSLISE